MKTNRQISSVLIACSAMIFCMSSVFPAAADDIPKSPSKTPRVITATKRTAGKTQPVKDAVTNANADSTTSTGTIPATDQDGKAVTVKLTDVGGLTDAWLKAAGYDATKSKVKVNLDTNGKITTFGIHDENDNIVAQYDPSSHLMQYYYTDSTLKGKINYVTSDSKNKYTWLGETGADPAMGKDGNVIVQKYFYDANNKVSSIQYYAFCAGARQETDSDGQ